MTTSLFLHTGINLGEESEELIDALYAFLASGMIAPAEVTEIRVYQWSRDDDGLLVHFTTELDAMVAKMAVPSLQPWETYRDQTIQRLRAYSERLKKGGSIGRLRGNGGSGGRPEC